MTSQPHLHSEVLEVVNYVVFLDMGLSLNETHTSEERLVSPAMPSSQQLQKNNMKMNAYITRLPSSHLSLFCPCRVMYITCDTTEQPKCKMESYVTAKSRPVKSIILFGR